MRTVGVSASAAQIRLALSCFAALLAAPFPAALPAAEPRLFFSLKTWEGEYASKDVPGGVETTPAVGAIYTINADGSGLKKIVRLGKNCDYPTASPDGRWIYLQSNATGDSQVYRCKPDGSEPTSLTKLDGAVFFANWGPAK
jgi:hypothetical protein